MGKRTDIDKCGFNRKTMLNGVLIPYDTTFPVLQTMLRSNDMQQFAIACEVLSQRTDLESFNALKDYLTDSDKYKHLYALKTIFRHPRSVMLTHELKNSLLAKDVMFVKTALEIIIEQEILVSDEKIISAIISNINELDSYYIQSLSRVDNNEVNFQSMIHLYQSVVGNNGKRAALARILRGFTSAERFDLLFSMFSRDNYSKVRMEAYQMAIQHKRINLLEIFRTDPDGHIRKRVESFFE